MVSKIDEKKAIVFGLTNQLDLAKLVASSLRIKLTEIDTTIFSDKEILVKSSKTVRNKIAYIICSLDSHNALMELLLFVDSLKRASVSKTWCIKHWYNFFHP